MEVLLDEKPMVRKEFADANGAVRAMRGHEVLKTNLPQSEVSLLVPMELDSVGNSVVMPILNEEAWVVSMGRNHSADREDLKMRTIETIPNFDATVKQLMDAVQSCGNKCLMIGPDVYFLTVDRKTHALGYVYADTESVTVDRQNVYADEDIPLMNVYWAAGVLHLFLRECVQNPEPYLVRVRQEAVHRMNGCGMENHWKKELLEGKEFNWPASSWSQKLLWILELAKRQAVSAWHS
jgi:hypothetical protein